MNKIFTIKSKRSKINSTMKNTTKSIPELKFKIWILTYKHDLTDYNG